MRRAPFFPLHTRSPPAPGQQSGLLEPASPEAVDTCLNHQAASLGARAAAGTWRTKGFPMAKLQVACTPQSCGFVKCLCSLFCKNFPHCLSRLLISKSSLSHLKSHMTLEGLIFKNLFKVLHNQAGICIVYHKSQSSFSFSMASSQNCNTTLATKSLRPACPSGGIPWGHPVLPGAFQSDQAGFGSSAKQRATSWL